MIMDLLLLSMAAALFGLTLEILYRITSKIYRVCRKIFRKQKRMKKAKY